MSWRWSDRCIAKTFVAVHKDEVSAPHHGILVTMSPSFARGVWTCVLIAACSYAGYTFFGSQLLAQSSGAQSPVLIRDVITPGKHEFSGVVPVGFSCETLSVKVVTQEHAEELQFTTWADPAVTCSPGPVPRQFSTEAFGPADQPFVATLDGEPLAIAVLRETTQQKTSH